MKIIFFIIVIVVHLHGTSANIFQENVMKAKFEMLTGNLSKILCSIDLKFISVCFEKNSKSEIVDDLLRKTLGCIPAAPIGMFG